MNDTIQRMRKKFRWMLISLVKYNLPKSHQISHEIPPSVHKMGAKCKTMIFCFFIMVFNFAYVYIINCGLSKCMH